MNLMNFLLKIIRMKNRKNILKRLLEQKDTFNWIIQFNENHTIN